MIGFMASGKSTVGRLLAERLGRPFVDSDDRVEQLAGATVAELFQRGEARFRAYEAEVIATLCGEGEQVVATGGGAPAHGDNMDRMLKAGVVISLVASPQQILERIGDASTRPLLAGATDKLAEVRRLLGVRAGAYARAHEIVDTDGKPPSQVARDVAWVLGC